MDTGELEESEPRDRGGDHFRQNGLRFESDFDRGFALFLRLAFLHGCANLARMLAVKSFGQCGRDGFFLRKLNGHSDPCSGLQNNPVATQQLEGGDERKNSSEEGHSRYRYSRAPQSVKFSSTKVAPARRSF